MLMFLVNYCFRWNYDRKSDESKKVPKGRHDLWEL